MKIVCLSTLGVSTGFVVDRLLQAFPDTLLVRLRCEPRSRSVWNKFLRFARGHGLRRVEERLFYNRHQARGSEHVQRLLFGDRPIPDRPVIAELPTTVVNHISTATLLRSFRPDVMLTIGAPLLKPHIFSIPAAGTINLHFGIAPYYRGEETLFWPLYCRDEQQIGVTIHQIDRGIDTGPMLAQGFVAVDAEDTEWTLDAKTARLGADLLVELLRAGQLQPCWQFPHGSLGRQFNYKSRHVWHDAMLYARRRWLHEPLHVCEQHVINYCVPQTECERESREMVLQQ